MDFCEIELGSSQISLINLEREVRVFSEGEGADLKLQRQYEVPIGPPFYFCDLEDSLGLCNVGPKGPNKSRLSYAFRFLDSIYTHLLGRQEGI